MKNISIFQIVLFAIAVVSILIGVWVLATLKSNTAEEAELVTMWGVVDGDVISSLVEEVNKQNPKSLNISYTQFDINTLERELLEALAEDRGPDVILIPLTHVSRQESKTVPIPYDSYSERTFKNSFVEGTELLLKEDNMVGFPFMIDPLVLYWNRDSFTNAGISTAPSYWDQVTSIAPLLTERDSKFNIFKSAISLGEFRNINNAKEIFSTLMLQAGNPIIIRDNNGNLRSVIDQKYGLSKSPAELSVSFYTQFVNPVSNQYTWNRSLPTSQDMFVAGDLAMYIGFASEYNVIQRRNPNLNFDVAIMPQSRTGGSDIYADIYTLLITRQVSNISSAFSTILNLTSADSVRLLEEIAFLPPIRRDVLSSGSSDAAMSVFYDSSLRSKGVLEYDEDETNRIYRDMIEAFVSGRLNIDTAINRANAERNNLIQ